MANQNPVKAGFEYAVKLRVGITDDNTGRVLLADQEFETIVTPKSSIFTNMSALQLRCENLALAEFSKKLWKDIEADSNLADKLENKDWSIKSKTLRCTELIRQPETTE